MSQDDGEVRIRGGQGTILVGVDGSEHSRLALKWAADEAKRRGSLLRIICGQGRENRHVPEWYKSDSSDLSPGQAILDDAYGLVATRHPSVVARVEATEWGPAVALTVASRTADVLVVGARGRGGFQELLLGSVSDQCIQHARCPVAVVRTDPDDLPLRAVERRITVGIDGSLGSTRALKWALEEAYIRSASVEATYAWQYPPIGSFVLSPREEYDVTSREIVNAAAESAEKLAPNVPFVATARFDGTVPALLDACQGADLLVVGSRGHQAFKQVLLGSVAHQCARHAKCTVIIVRPFDCENGSQSTEQIMGKRSDRRSATIAATRSDSAS